MGCVGSKTSSASNGDQMPSQEKVKLLKEIDAQLRKDGTKEQEVVKMLLLGAGESGKSTVVKQMDLIYSGAPREDMRRDYVDVIRWNSIQSMQSILDALPSLQLRLSEEKASSHADFLLSLSGNEALPRIAAKVEAAIICLRDNPSIKAAMDQRHTFQLNDSAEYFFAEISRTTSDVYVPTDVDVLRARVKTTIHCFENVNVLLFVVSISEYDQVIREDKNQARMTESLEVYDAIVNSKWFVQSAQILFMNKIDLLKAKLPKSSIQKYYPEYLGSPTDSEAVISFFRKKFLNMVKDKKKIIYIHETQATDTKMMQKVLSSVVDILLRKHFKGVGLL